MTQLITTYTAHPEAVPWEDYTEDDVLTLVRHTPSALEHIPHQTPELCLEAVKRDGLTVRWIRVLTLKLCLAAVKENGAALEYIPPQFQRFSVCRAAVLKHTPALQWVHHQTEDLCHLVLRLNPYALRYVRNQTTAVCLTAIAHNCHSIICVRNLTPEILTTAIDRNPYVLRYVSYEVRKQLLESGDNPTTN